MKITNKNKSKKALIIFSVIAAVLLLGGGVFAISRVIRSKNSQSPTVTISPNAQTSSASSTSLINDNTGSTTTNVTQKSASSTSTSVPVVIVDASKYNSVIEVRAYADIVESGTCSYTFTDASGASFTQQSDTVTGASTTSCKTIDVPFDKFLQSTSWTVAISYKSNSGNYSGNSVIQPINFS